MKLSTVVLIVVLVIVALFAAFNWTAFTEPSELSLGFTTAHIPLGLVLLACMALIAVLFLIIVVRIQASALAETRRNSRELEASRELAQDAEASRYTELRRYLEAEISRQVSVDAEATSAILQQIRQSEAGLEASIEEAGNTLAAYIGELEDRITRGAPSAMTAASEGVGGEADVSAVLGTGSDEGAEALSEGGATHEVDLDASEEGGTEL